jgi:LysR family glycine cleavage system transcriptional activator
VRIETSTELADLVCGPFDAAIRFGEGRWPGLLAEPLFETRVFAVAAPAHWSCGLPVDRAALDRATLLGIAHTPSLWPQYLAGLGLAGYRPCRVQTFDNVQVMHEAAANGLGLALTVLQLVEAQIVAGRLAPAFNNPPVPVRQAYYLVCRKDRRDEPALRALREALLGCAGLT